MSKLYFYSYEVLERGVVIDSKEDFVDLFETSKFKEIDDARDALYDIKAKIRKELSDSSLSVRIISFNKV
jgi:hypothetical protein